MSRLIGVRKRPKLLRSPLLIVSTRAAQRTSASTPAVGLLMCEPCRPIGPGGEPKPSPPQPWRANARSRIRARGRSAPRWCRRADETEHVAVLAAHREEQPSPRLSRKIPLPLRSRAPLVARSRTSSTPCRQPLPRRSPIMGKRCRRSPCVGASTCRWPALGVQVLDQDFGPGWRGPRCRRWDRTSVNAEGEPARKRALGDRVRRHHGADGEAPTEVLRQRHDVRHHAVLLVGVEGAELAQSGLRLVQNQQRAARLEPRLSALR